MEKCENSLIDYKFDSRIVTGKEMLGIFIVVRAFHFSVSSEKSFLLPLGERLLHIRMLTFMSKRHLLSSGFANDLIPTSHSGEKFTFGVYQRGKHTQRI